MGLFEDIVSAAVDDPFLVFTTLEAVAEFSVDTFCEEVGREPAALVLVARRLWIWSLKVVAI